MIKRDNLIFGRNAVMEALKANRVVSLYLEKGFTDKKVLDYVKGKLEVKYVDKKELDNACEGVHQNCAATIKPYEYMDLEGALRIASKDERPIILILDGIEDPHNFGAILRSADIFGVSAVIISKHNQIPLNSTVAKTSAGAINYVPVCMVNNLNQAIDKLKADGYWVVSSDGSADTLYSDIKYDFKVALVIGSEGFGVSKLVLKNSDYIVKIPMRGKVNSLNASVATGILLANIRK